MPWKWLLALIFVLPFPRQTLCQSSDEGGTPSLAAAAKKNKDTSKTKATRVFTDENMSLRANPIPTISLQGADNTQDVVDSIHEFRSKHDAAETERVVHDWFDEENAVLSAAIDGNTKMAVHYQLKMEAAQDAMGYPNRFDGDYGKLQQWQLSQRWAQRSDARVNRDNWQTISRIQQTLARVRIDVILNRGKTAYDWFKIRTANGMGTY